MSQVTIEEQIGAMLEQRGIFEGNPEGALYEIEHRLRALAPALANAEKNAERLRMLHTELLDADGCEFGIYRVKWVNGDAKEVWQTAGDFSDLDAAIAQAKITK